MAQIELRGLAHSYQPEPQKDSDYAIHSLNHVLPQGGAYALLGPSGCGKSTLLNIISGLLVPSSGQVLFDGHDVSDLPTHQRNIAQVFQFPVVYDGMTVADNLAFPLRNQGLDKVRIKQKVEEVAALFDLQTVLGHKARNLSADVQQKVSMARGLVREDVSAILFDEPLTVIDPHLKWKLRRKLRQLHQQLNITMLYVTHDQLEAATFADKIALMHEGRIVQFGTPQELFERPNHTFVGYFIGSPGMNFLPATRSADGLQVIGKTLVLTSRQQRALELTTSDNLKVGIRPEFIEIVPVADSPLTASVLSCDNLGMYQLLTVVIGGTELKVRVDEHFIVSNNVIGLRFPQQWLKLYIDEYLAGEPVEEDCSDD